MPGYDMELRLDNVSCSWRIMRLRNTMDGLPRGARLLVASTDLSLRFDLEAYVRQAGHELLQVNTAQEEISFLIEKH